MFNSKAKYYNNLFIIITRVIFLFVSSVPPLLLMLNGYGIIDFIPKHIYYPDPNNPWISLLTTILFLGIVFVPLGVLYLIVTLIIKAKCIKIFARECQEIIDSTVLPEKLPKVVYIYTTHNDLIEARVLQNLRQTYKNFELWVSDGSSSSEWNDKIKKFCEREKINLYKLPTPSKNKADNLNQFLSWYKKDYDYLVVADADEAFHEKFVEYSIKMFCSNKIKNLTFISPLNLTYRCKGMYANGTRFIEGLGMYWILLPKSFSYSDISAFSGQSCIVSKKSLIECYGSSKFDDGNLEDWYTEALMVEKANYGIMLPNTPCYYEPDFTIKAHFNRIMRIQDWRIRWWKIRPKKIINNFNSRYTNWYITYFLQLVVPLLTILFFGLLSVALWVVIDNWNYAFKDNILFWCFIGITLGLGIIFWIVNYILIGKINFNIWDFIFSPFVFFLWIFVANIKTTIHWFKSLFLGKYSQFGGSGKARFFSGKNQIYQWWLSLLIFSIIIVAFNVPMFLLTNWNSLLLLIIVFNVYFGVVWFGIFSYLVLWYINFIPYNNSFSREDWIDTKEIF